MWFAPRGWHPVKRQMFKFHFNALLSVAQILFFFMVHDKLYYFVFKSIAKSGPGKLVQVLVLCF